MDDTLGQRIRKLRENKHLKQSDLAKLIGITAQAVSAYENDIREPSYDVLKSMSRIFKVSTDYLLGVRKNMDIHTDGLDEDVLQIIFALIEYGSRNKK